MRFAGLCLAFVALIGPGMLRAQATGTLSGFVKDPSGAVVARAKVTAAQVERGTTAVAETNSEGFYSFPALEPGPTP
jgi:hypothetical protein